MRVVLFPGITGEDRLFVETMALAFPNDDTETVRYPGIIAPSVQLMDLSTTADGIASRMTVAALLEPVVFVGYSYGGNLAFEVAHRLIARGGRIARLILVDPALPNTAFRLRGNEPARELAAGPAPSGLYAVRLARIALFVVGVLLPSRLRKKLTRRILYDLRVHARRLWVPRPIAARVLHIVSAQLAPVVSEGWMRLCPLIRQVVVSGSHIDILRLPGRTDVASAIRMELDGIGGDGLAAPARLDRARL
jgi:thioesterase domain-containing protein